MRIQSLLMIMLFGAGVSACSDSEPITPPPKPITEQQEPVLFESQRQALERAKGVGEMLKQDADQLNKSIERQDAPSQ